MKVCVRRYDNDRPLIEYLDSRLFTDEERVEDIDQSAWWVGFTEAGVPVAYGGIRLVNGDPTTAFLSRAGVLPEARGQGLQMKLLALRTRWARAQGCSQIITYTHKDNIRSANNLIRSGFLLYSPEWPWVGNDDFLYWMKTL